MNESSQPPHDRVLARVARRLLPFLFLLYVVNILDRTNVGLARLQMLPDLGLSEQAYAFGAGLFYIGYFLFEVPSNIILARIGARRWIARIMVTWGFVTCAMMAVQGPAFFYFLRILLGLAEAGFFPGIILYLTYWFPARDRARAVAFFMAASPITGMLGGPTGGAILQFMDEVGGLRGWQWLFILEGIPAIVLGIIVLRRLPDGPADAAWLTNDEKASLIKRLAAEEHQRATAHGLTLSQSLTDGRIWLLVLLYFTIATGSNAFGFYLPELIKSRFMGLTEFEIGLLAAVPNAVAVPLMILNGYHSDRTGERRWHVAVPALVASFGWLLCASVDSPWPSLAALTLIQVGIMSMIPTFWSLPTALLSGMAAAGGIALVNAVGNLGGFLGPNILGQSRELTDGFVAGLLTLAGVMVVGAGLTLLVGRESRLALTQRRSP